MLKNDFLSEAIAVTIFELRKPQQRFLRTPIGSGFH
jgi:hypothetical protein